MTILPNKTVCLVLFIAAAMLGFFAGDASAWSGDTFTSITRDQIVSKASEMINYTWSPTRGMRNRRSTGDNYWYNYYSYQTYTGIAYSWNNPQENLDEFVNFIANGTEFQVGDDLYVSVQLSLRSGPGVSFDVLASASAADTVEVLANANNGIWADGYHWWNVKYNGQSYWCAGGSANNDYLFRQTGYGNDCSGFVSICWKLPSRYTTWTFEDDAVSVGGCVDSLGNVGSCASANLKIGDACNNASEHIILYKETLSDGRMKSMEQTPTVARERVWYWSSLSDYRPVRRRLITEPAFPMVETRDSTNLTATSVTLNAVITDSGSSAISNRLFTWAANENGTDNVATNVQVNGTSFSCNIAGFQPDTDYYFRAWAKNSSGWISTPPVNFKTKCMGDINSDNEVDFIDYTLLTNGWNDTCSGPVWCNGSDFDQDGHIGINDFYLLVQNWLSGTDNF